MLALQGLFMMLLAGVAVTFWVRMIIDCAMKETGTGSSRTLWMVVIVFGSIPGAAMYYFSRLPRRDWERNSGHWSVYNRAKQ